MSVIALRNKGTKLFPRAINCVLLPISGLNSESSPFREKEGGGEEFGLTLDGGKPSRISGFFASQGDFKSQGPHRQDLSSVKVKK